jgi:hypothetical protein
MALEIGDITASSGMSKAIYDQLDTLLSPPLEGMAEEDMEKVRDSWKKIAFAIATGVIEHIKSNMEIYGVEVSISDVSTTVSTVTTCPAGAGSGTGSGSGTATGQQSNDGTGHVK